MKTNNSYILCGNFQTRQDSETGEIDNHPSGMKMPEFYCSMRSFADARSLTLVDFFSDAVLMTGDESDIEILADSTGQSFSYALIDNEGRRKALEMEAAFSPRKMAAENRFYLS